MGLLHFQKWRCLSGVAIAAVVDNDPSKAMWARANGIPFFCKSEDLVGRVDAAIIATPVDQHAPCALPLLAAGIHCLIEKPIALNLDQAQLIVRMAARHRVFLAVGHSERFNPALQYVHDAMGLAPKMLEVFRMASVVHLRNPNVDVVQDLMVHDLDWILDLVGQDASHVRVREARWMQDMLSYVRCEINFPEHLQVILTSSHLDIHRRREVVLHSVNGSRRSINLDTTKNDHLLDPLEKQARAFLSAIRGKPSPIATGEEALRVMSMVDLIRQRCGEHHAETQYAHAT